MSLVAASGVAVVIGTSFASSPKNLIANPGFEDNLTGWTKLSGPLHLARTNSDAHGGTYSAQLSVDKVATAVLKDAPNTVKDTNKAAVYHASIWVQAGTSGEAAVLRLREVKNGHLAGQLSKQVSLTDAAWHEITIDYTARTDGGSLDYNVLARNLGAGQVMLADDAWLSTDDPAPVADPTTPAPSPEPTKPPVVPPVVTPPVVTPPVVTPPVVTPPVVSGNTLFGSSIYQEPGESFQQAYARRVATFGKLSIDRVFYPGLPKAWPGNAGYGGGDVVVSFKVSPQTVLTGAYDATLTNWFATAPRDREIWWSYFHEPEDQIANGDFTADQYRAAWQRISALASAAGNDNLHATLVLMCFTLDKGSGRNFNDYYPGQASIDYIAFDCYNQQWSKGAYIDPSVQFAPVLAASAATGKPWGIAEFGSHLIAGDTGAGRAAWLKASGAWLAAHNATFVSYFDSPVNGEYRLLDAASQAAWRTVVTTM